MGEGRFARLRRRVGALDDALTGLDERFQHPFATSRWSSLTGWGTATVTGVANLPGTESNVPYDSMPECNLFRLDVRRDDGTTFTCGTIQESASGITRQVEPGLVLDVRVHPTEAKAAADWQRNADRLGRRLEWRRSPVNWAEPAEWPAEGAVEVRWRRRDQARLDERRAAWRRLATALVDLDAGREDWAMGRRQYTLTVDVEGQRRELQEAIPDLAAARLVEVRVEPDRRVLTFRTGAPLVALTDGQEVVVDWEATLGQPEFRGLEGIDAT